MGVYWNDTEDRPRFGAWIATIIVVVILLVVGAYVFRWVTAPAVGKLEAREQIQSGDFRIQAYDQFFNACASVQAIEQTIAASDAQLKVTTNPEDVSRIQTNITGNVAARAAAVAQYNADARKGYTVGQFRDSGLPYHLPTEYEIGDNTSCVS